MPRFIHFIHRRNQCEFVAVVLVFSDLNTYARSLFSTVASVLAPPPNALCITCVKHCSFLPELGNPCLMDHPIVESLSTNRMDFICQQLYVIHTPARIVGTKCEELIVFVKWNSPNRMFDSATRYKKILRTPLSQLIVCSINSKK